MANKIIIPQNFPGPDTIGRFCLPNGMTLLTFNNPGVQSVNLIGLLENGARLDAPDKLGTAHFTASMLSRGTTAISFAEYHDILESRGASLSFSSGTHQTWFRGKGLAEDLGILLTLTADSLRRPVFAPDYLERMRQQLLAGLAIREQDTSDISSLLFDQALFPNHPYGNPVDGTIETITAITRQDIVDYHARYFNPAEVILVIAGALNGVNVQALVEGCFADWFNTSSQVPAPPPIPPAPASETRVHRFIEDKSQCDLILGTFGPSRASGDYLPAYLGNNILGQFGLMGRIGESVRSKSGLAYHAASSLNAWTDGGSWEFSAGLNPENLEKVIRLIKDEIRRYIDAPVTPDELDDSQSNLVGRLPLSLETSAGIASAILTMERFELGLDYYQRYGELIRAISAQDIQETAQRYLHPDKLVIASAGTGADIP